MVLGIAFSGSLALYTFRVLLRLWDEIAVDETGIWLLPRRGAITHLAWDDVHDVRAHEVTQWLEVVDRENLRRVRVDYQIDDSVALRDFIASHVPPMIRERAVGRRVYHRLPINKALYLISATVFSYWVCLAFVQHKIGVVVLPSGLLAGAVALALRDPSSIEIGEDGFTVRYPGWSRVFRFSEVRAVSLSDMRNQANIYPAVTVEFHGRKTIRLLRIREGTRALYDALNASVMGRPDAEWGA